MTPWDRILEGLFFAIGFWPIYAGLDYLANRIPAWQRMRASKAAKQLRMTKPKEKETVVKVEPSNN